MCIGASDIQLDETKWTFAEFEKLTYYLLTEQKTKSVIVFFKPYFLNEHLVKTFGKFGI